MKSCYGGDSFDWLLMLYVDSLITEAEVGVLLRHNGEWFLWAASQSCSVSSKS